MTEDSGKTLRPASRSIFAVVALVAAAVISVPVLLHFSHRTRDPNNIPVLWELPHWELESHLGRPFSDRDLRGRVYIANFIFTRCVASCPLLTRTMAIVQHRIDHMSGDIQLVSISVDPKWDTAERLRAYAQRNGAQDKYWTFLTGPEDRVLQTITDGFRAMVEKPDAGGSADFNPVELAHANRFALVDGQGRLRGSYDTGEDGLDQLVEDATALAIQARRAR